LSLDASASTYQTFKPLMLSALKGAYFAKSLKIA
jgi:hypothetical protein